MDVKSLHWAVVADRRAGIAAQVLQGVAARGEGGQVDAHHGGAPERWCHEGQREVRRPVGVEREPDVASVRRGEVQLVKIDRKSCN